MIQNLGSSLRTFKVVQHLKDKFIEMARTRLADASRILVMSGAGLSTEAGIPDFRSKNGLYSVNFHGHSPETILSHSFYLNEPDLFYEYLRTRLNCSGILPDESYQLLARLEETGKVAGIITQNIDSLHREAGSRNVIELHGSLKRSYCDKCETPYSGPDLMDPATSFRCQCGGIFRPDVVLFDENVPQIGDAWLAADQADLLLVLGTSLVVYPAAQLPTLFLDKGLPVIIINRDPTPYALSRGVIEINGEIGATLKQLFPDYFDPIPDPAAAL